MSLPKNYKEFPDNVQKPSKIELLSRTYTICGYRFRGLQDFYEFLKKDPKVNLEIWKPNNLQSVKGDFNFAGEEYDVAVEKLIRDVDPGYQEYLRIQKNLHAKYGKSHQYEPIKTIAGGAIDPVAYTTGSPTIYQSSRLVSKPKFITIDTQVAYYWGTSKKQVFNRALIITNLISALEKIGYNVDVNSFMIAENENEIIKSIFEIKRHGQRTNYQTLYKSLVDVEFFRRLCFRLIEISDVKTDWLSGYGETCSERKVRRILNLKKEDIYFDQPRSMGISGNDIGDDFESAIKHLKLEDKINVKKEKEVLRNSVKVLRR